MPFSFFHSLFFNLAMAPGSLSRTWMPSPSSKEQHGLQGAREKIQLLLLHRKSSKQCARPPSQACQPAIRFFRHQRNEAKQGKTSATSPRAQGPLMQPIQTQILASPSHPSHSSSSMLSRIHAWPMQALVGCLSVLTHPSQLVGWLADARGRTRVIQKRRGLVFFSFT